MLLPGWIVYIGTPIYNMILLDDADNVAKKNEKVYINNQGYYAPMWALIFFQFASYLWCLALFSTHWKPDHWVFEMKPEGTF